MNRVHALVEGQTEEAFIGRCLQPHLWARGVDIRPKIIVTRRVRSGPDHKGGVSSWGHIERDLRLLLQDTSVVAVTNLLDYYSLPVGVPGMAVRPGGSPLARVRFVEAAVDAHMADRRLHTYLALHEFEALLYADPELCGQYLAAPGLAIVMRAALSQCGGPEFVNDNVATAPSKRILAAHPEYQKTLHGPALAARIGLPALRSACPHFDEWITWLESLGA